MGRRAPDIAALRQALDGGAYESDPRQVATATIRRLIVHNLMVGDARLAEAMARQLVPDDAASAAEQLKRYAVDLRHTYEDNLRRTRELEERALATVRALAAAVAERDDDTGNHVQRVHDLGLLFARSMCPDEAGDPEMAYGFILHDVGKVAVPDAVLRKPGPLTDTELELMRIHPEAGARMLDPVPFLARARAVVLHHHERWDGAGYPHGLRGEEIPLWARIFAVVDTVDAMTSHRPYRAALRLEAALDEVAKEAGAQFDPRCVETFLELDGAEMRRCLQRRPRNRFPALLELRDERPAALSSG